MRLFSVGGRSSPSARVISPNGLYVVARSPVLFDPNGTEPAPTNMWPITPPAPGNTLVLAFKPTLSEAVDISFTDNLGNVYTADHIGPNGHFYHINDIPNAPSSIHISVDTLIRARLYAVELGNCPFGVEVVSAAEATYTSQLGRSFTFLTASDDHYALAVTHTSPSRFPVIDAGSNLMRLLVDGAGNPFPQQVSEHAVDKVFLLAGEGSMGSTWPEGNPNGYAGGLCDGTTSRVLYRKITNPYPNVNAPSGSASFTANWTPEPGADGYLVFYDEDSQAYPDAALYGYRAHVAGQATSSLLISGIAANTYRFRVAPYVRTTVGQLSIGEITRTAS